MAQIFNILDDKVVINKLALRYLEGSVTHAGQLTLEGNASISNSLTVDSITVDTLKVKNLITESGAIDGAGKWFSSDEAGLNGKGLTWTHGTGDVGLMYRTGGRIWASSDIDLAKDKSYKIDNVSVISKTELGPQVKKSSLTEIGALRTLLVTGTANLGQFAYVNGDSGRFGLNTDEPNGMFGLVKNNVEVVIDSPDINQAVIGTYTNHDLTLISDNTARVVLKNNGEVHIGHEATKTGVLRVFGTLYADNLIADTRMERTSSLEFKATRSDSIYGKGLVWSGEGAAKQLLLRSNPDRIWSSESVDLCAEKEYYINGRSVLSEFGLGTTVVTSNLTTVGVLKSLTVSGEARFSNNVEMTSVSIDTLNTSAVTAVNHFSVSTRSQQAFYADINEIEIGDKSNTRKPVKVFGPMSIGINTPDSSVDLAVRGNISFADKKFITGTGAPTSGTFRKGDICWNSNPTEFTYIGWVCVDAGSPGTWLPFGAIAR